MFNHASDETVYTATLVITLITDNFIYKPHGEPSVPQILIYEFSFSIIAINCFKVSIIKGFFLNLRRTARCASNQVDVNKANSIDLAYSNYLATTENTLATTYCSKALVNNKNSN